MGVKKTTFNLANKDIISVICTAILKNVTKHTNISTGGLGIWFIFSTVKEISLYASKVC